MQADVSARGIKKGTILKCVGAEDQDYAEIFENLQSSDIIGYVQRDTTVTVVGEPEDVEGFLMVPVEPTGAIQLDLFRVASPDVNQGSYPSLATTFPSTSVKSMASATESAEKPSSQGNAPADARNTLGSAKTIPPSAIDKGTILECVGNEAQDYAEVFESMDSMEIIRNVQSGAMVTAHGKAQDVDGFTMVPIEPIGAIQLDLFVVAAKSIEKTDFRVFHAATESVAKPRPKPKPYESPPISVVGHSTSSRSGIYASESQQTVAPIEIKKGTLLTCLGNEEQEYAEVFESTESAEVMRHVQRGTTLVAAGEVQEVEGFMMVPIKPNGAIQLDLFYATMDFAPTMTSTTTPGGEEALEEETIDMDLGDLAFPEPVENSSGKAVAAMDTKTSLPNKSPKVVTIDPANAFPKASTTPGQASWMFGETSASVAIFGETRPFSKPKAFATQASRASPETTPASSANLDQKGSTSPSQAFPSIFREGAPTSQPSPRTAPPVSSNPFQKGSTMPSQASWFGEGAPALQPMVRTAEGDENSLGFHLKGLDYSRIVADSSLRLQLRTEIGQHIAEHLGVDAELVDVTLSSGDIEVHASVRNSKKKLAEHMRDSDKLQRKVSKGVQNIPGIAKASKGPVASIEAAIGKAAPIEIQQSSVKAASTPSASPRTPSAVPEPDISQLLGVQTLKQQLAQTQDDLVRQRVLIEGVPNLKAALNMEENTVVELRRRLREARSDAEEAVSAAFQLRMPTNKNVSLADETLSALQAAPHQDVPAALVAALHEERRNNQMLRLELCDMDTALHRELHEVEDAAVETAEAAEIRVSQIEMAVRGRHAVVYAAEHAMQQELKARDEVWQEWEAADERGQMSRRAAEDLRFELSRARDEIQAGRNDVRREASVADGLRKGLHALGTELEQAKASKEFSSLDLPGRTSMLAWNATVANSGPGVGAWAEAMELRQQAQELKQELSSWRAHRGIMPEPLPPMDPSSWTWSQELEVTGEALKGFGINLGQLPQALEPSSMKPTRRGKQELIKIKLTIIGAFGLKKADMYDKSDPYCTCEVVGKKNKKVKTPMVANSQNPMWNHVAELEVSPGDALQFIVLDRDRNQKDDDVLGGAKLEYSQYWPRGYSTPMLLESAGRGVSASLAVKIEVVGGDQAPTTAKVEETVSLRNDAETRSLQRNEEAPLDLHKVRDAAQAVSRQLQPVQAGERVRHLNAPPPPMPPPTMDQQW